MGFNSGFKGLKTFTAFKKRIFKDATYNGTRDTWHPGNEGRPEIATNQLDTYMAKSTQHVSRGTTKIVVVYSNSRPHTNK